MEAESLSGRLLVATPLLGDPNFRRTVILIVEDEPEEGTLGVVLNRPTEVQVGQVLESWTDLVTGPSVVFRGGPVSPDVVVGLARAAPGVVAPEWRAVTASVGTVDLAVPPDAQPVPLAGVRLFSGYAGWAAGQLESELAERAWFVLDVVEADVFCADGERLWHDVMRRQGGELSLLAAYPKHPTMN